MYHYQLPKKFLPLHPPSLRYEFSKFFAKKKVENLRKFLLTIYFLQDKNHFYDICVSSIDPFDDIKKNFKNFKIWKLWLKFGWFFTNFKNSYLFLPPLKVFGSWYMSSHHERASESEKKSCHNSLVTEIWLVKIWYKTNVLYEAKLFFGKL